MEADDNDEEILTDDSVIVDKKIVGQYWQNELIIGRFDKKFNNLRSNGGLFLSELWCDFSN